MSRPTFGTAVLNYCTVHLQYVHQWNDTTEVILHIECFYILPLIILHKNTGVFCSKFVFYKEIRAVSWFLQYICPVMGPSRCPRSAATGCLPLTPNYLAREVWSGCAQWWCAHKVHTVQTVLCTPSPTPRLMSLVVCLSSSCAPLYSPPAPLLGSPTHLKLPLEAFRRLFTLPDHHHPRPPWFTAAVSADSSSWCS